METGFTIIKNRYFDSVFLMQVASRITEEPGIKQVAALMGTEKNIGLLAEIYFIAPEIISASPNDLVLALIGDDPATIKQVLENVDVWLTRKPSSVDQSVSHSFHGALSRQNISNLAVISIPGEYASKEAMTAMEAGLNAFIFSSNVPIEEELELKEFAKERGLIVMGPDAGTSIIAGAGIGFANAVRKGNIGVIGSSGTGLQEFTSLVHQSGLGISHAIGTGSNDLSNTIGGISTFIALNALEADPDTKVITVISKPPGDKTLTLLIERLNGCTKPIITCFLGLDELPAGIDINFSSTTTMYAAAVLAINAVRGESKLDDNTEEFKMLLEKEKAGISLQQKYIRGIFAGGTFTYQAQQILRSGEIVAYSNSPIRGMKKMADPYKSEEHTLVDMGDELFTDGRLHPMIDSTLRRERILEEAQDPEMAILLLDFILGYNSSVGPVGDLIDAIKEAKENALSQGGYLPVIASVTGTDDDPQDMQTQIRVLEDSGVIVFPSSAHAAVFCRELIKGLAS